MSTCHCTYVVNVHTLICICNCTLCRHIYIYEHVHPYPYINVLLYVPKHVEPMHLCMHSMHNLHGMCAWYCNISAATAAAASVHVCLVAPTTSASAYLWQDFERQSSPCCCCRGNCAPLLLRVSPGVVSAGWGFVLTQFDYVPLLLHSSCMAGSLPPVVRVQSLVVSGLSHSCFLVRSSLL